MFDFYITVAIIYIINHLYCINPMETREKRFKRIAEKRTDRVLNDVRILGNCSNKSTYSYTEEEVNKIFRTIDEELKHAKAKFKTSRSKKFTL